MKIYLYLALFLISYTGSSQTRLQDRSRAKNIQPLKVGEKFPDVGFTIYQNGKKSQAKLSDFAGKTVILIHWATTCGSCIESMPKEVLLQKEVGDKAKILLYTPNSEEEINAFWINFKKMSLKAEGLYQAFENLPFIKSDTVLAKLVPAQVAGIHTWINKTGEFMAHAYPESTTASSIETMHAGKQPPLISYKQLRYDLMIENPINWVNLLPNDLNNYSLQFGRLPSGWGWTPRKLVDSFSKKLIGFTFLNAPLDQLFKAAYFGFGEFVYDFQLEIPNNLRGNFQQCLNEDSIPYHTWVDSNTFSYALKIPISQSDSVYSIFKNDLRRYFGVTGHLVKRKIKAVYVKGDGNIFGSKNPNIKHDSGQRLKENQYVFDLKGYSSIPALFGLVQEMYPGITIVKELKNQRTAMLDIELPYKSGVKLTAQEINAIKEALFKAGIEIVEGEKEMDVLVLEKI